MLFQIIVCNHEKDTFCLYFTFSVYFCYQWHFMEFIFQPITYMESGDFSYLCSNHSLICMHSTYYFQNSVLHNIWWWSWGYVASLEWVLVSSYWWLTQYQKGKEFTFVCMEAFIDMAFLQSICYSLTVPFIHHPVKLSTEHLTKLCQMLCRIKCVVMQYLREFKDV